MLYYLIVVEQRGVTVACDAWSRTIGLEQTKRGPATACRSLAGGGAGDLGRDLEAVPAATSDAKRSQAMI